MREVVGLMTADEINAVAQYIARMTLVTGANANNVMQCHGVLSVIKTYHYLLKE